VGTGGSEEENTWALAKARFDAETFWYRGNGSFASSWTKSSPPLVPGPQYAALRQLGHHSAWFGLLGSSPISVSPARSRPAARSWPAAIWRACSSSRGRAARRPGVAAVSGTGIVGMRLAGGALLPVRRGCSGLDDLRVRAMETGIGGIRGPVLRQRLAVSAANAAWRD